MISLDSLAAFSANPATTPATTKVGQARTSAGLAGGVQRARGQAAGPSGSAQTQPRPLPSTPDKPLPRGSLLNLQV